MNIGKASLIFLPDSGADGYKTHVVLFFNV